MPNYDITITPQYSLKQYLYNNGNQCKDITGGYKFQNILSYGVFSGTVYSRDDGDGIHLYINGHTDAGGRIQSANFGSNNLIDLTNINEITFVTSIVSSCSFGIDTNYLTYYWYPNIVATKVSDTNYVHPLLDPIILWERVL